MGIPDILRSKTKIMRVRTDEVGSHEEEKYSLVFLTCQLVHDSIYEVSKT